MYVKENDFVRIVKEGYPHPFKKGDIVKVLGYNNPLYVKDSELRVQHWYNNRIRWIKEEDVELVGLDFKIDILTDSIKDWESDEYTTKLGFCYYYGGKYNGCISHMILDELKKDFPEFDPNSQFWFGETVGEISFYLLLRSNKSRRISLLKKTLKRLENERSMQNM